MYYLVKQGDTWYGTEFEAFDAETVRDFQTHLEYGDTIVIGTSLELLCDRLNIHLADVTMV